jgi:multiple sugar transport system substrate-binding protein
MGVSGFGVRWKDPDARNELEIWWPEKEIKALLRWFKDLSQYSPDPTSISWSSSIQNYLGGQFAQQFHLNNWISGIAASSDITQIAYNTGVEPLPYWKAGGVGKGDSWAYSPNANGQHIFSGGDNSPGAKEWLRWIYADSLERTASLYEPEPTRYVPIYDDIIQSSTFRSYEFWEQGENEKLLEEMEYIKDTIVGEHYAQVPESQLKTASPVALYLRRQWFYGEMVNRVVTGTNSVQGAYEWGRARLETRLEEGRERFAQ